MARLVVAYDVADDRRRVRLHTLLLGYGEPVQESVFECDLDERQTRELMRRVRRVVRPRGGGLGDKVRFYPLCVRCAGLIQDEAGPLGATTPTVLF